MGVREAEQFVELVRSNPELSNNVGGARPEDIERAESALGVTFPPSYRRFIEELGDCDIAGEEFYGVFVRDTDPSTLHGAVKETLDLRAGTREEGTGMPSSMIAFRPDGMGGYFVLDTARRDESGEAPVYVWEPGASKAGDELEHIGPDFGTVALRLATRAVQNWSG